MNAHGLEKTKIAVAKSQYDKRTKEIGGGRTSKE